MKSSNGLGIRPCRAPGGRLQQAAPRLAVLRHDLGQLASRGRMAAKADQEPAQASQLVAKIRSATGVCHVTGRLKRKTRAGQPRRRYQSLAAVDRNGW